MIMIHVHIYNVHDVSGNIPIICITHTVHLHISGKSDILCKYNYHGFIIIIIDYTI